jgi:hypothetical protein
MKRLPLFLALTLVAACGADSDLDQDLGKADRGGYDSQEPVEAENLYYYAQQDFSRCAAPACGGVHLEEVNADATTCADGSSGDTCYAGDVDFSSLNLSAEQQETLADQLGSGQILLRGQLESRPTSRGDYGNLVVTEVWTMNGSSDHDHRTFWHRLHHLSLPGSPGYPAQQRADQLLR